MGHGLCRYCVSLLLDTDGEVEMPAQWTLRVLDVDKQNLFMNTMQVKDFEDHKRSVPNPYMHTHIETHACMHAYRFTNAPLLFVYHISADKLEDCQR